MPAGSPGHARSAAPPGPAGRAVSNKSRISVAWAALIVAFVTSSTRRLASRPKLSIGPPRASGPTWPAPTRVLIRNALPATASSVSSTTTNSSTTPRRPARLRSRRTARACAPRLAPLPPRRAAGAARSAAVLAGPWLMVGWLLEGCVWGSRSPNASRPRPGLGAPAAAEVFAVSAAVLRGHSSGTRKTSSVLTAFSKFPSGSAASTITRMSFGPRGKSKGAGKLPSSSGAVHAQT